MNDKNNFDLEKSLERDELLKNKTNYYEIDLMDCD